MRPADFDTIEFDFDDPEKWESPDDELLAGLTIAAVLLFIVVGVLKNGTPTDAEIKQLLDFIGPRGAGEHCFDAWCVLTTGSISRGNYDDFCNWVRREVRRAYAAGRVKDEGQRRVRRPKSAPGQADLFGFPPVEGKSK